MKEVEVMGWPCLLSCLFSRCPLGHLAPQNANLYVKIKNRDGATRDSLGSSPGLTFMSFVTLYVFCVRWRLVSPGVLQLGLETALLWDSQG